MPGTTETAIERRNPSIATVDADTLTVQLSDKSTFQQVVRHLDERGVEIYKEVKP